ncbi:MAG: histidinol phosphate phosphatase domain-containing protein [Nitrospinota bacterium]
MIDLHTHTLFSDGELLPSELVRRAEAIGYKAIAITDHVDISNYDFIAERIIRVTGSMKDRKIRVIAGVEITHVEPALIGSLVAKLRAMQIGLILVHGETIVEPVMEGTNRAAIDAKVDILAHPGLIDIEDARLAATNNVGLEITSRGGHSYCNGHVANVAAKAGANLYFSTDTHKPSDLITEEMAKLVAIGAGLSYTNIEVMFNNNSKLVSKILG